MVITIDLPARSCLSMRATMVGSNRADSFRKTTGASSRNCGVSSIGMPIIPRNECRKSSPEEWYGL